LRSRRIAEENYSWWRSFSPQLSQGTTTPLLIKWISDEMGYGAFAETDLALGDFAGEYTGLVRPLFRRRPDHNPYCFHYPTRLWSFNYYVVDALREGNLMRFVNHSNKPNLLPLCMVNNGILHLVFVASQHIPKGTELVFDYGKDFWIHRTKEKM
jgi:Proteins containing SET domain